jgi:hypothetical protein
VTTGSLVRHDSASVSDLDYDSMLEHSSLKSASAAPTGFP